MYLSRNKVLVSLDNPQTSLSIVSFVTSFTEGGGIHSLSTVTNAVFLEKHILLLLSFSNVIFQSCEN